jgi:FkbM family methyltransferase
MRPSDIGAFFALRRHVARPWAAVRLRKSAAPFLDLPLRNGASFRLRPEDRHIFYGVFARDEYSLNGFGPGSLDTVIDIGAHIGTFAVRAASIARRVLSYEPMPENFALLTRNVERFSHVRPFRMAVAGRRGKMELFLGGNPARNSMLERRARSPRGAISVDCTTLADIFAERAVDRCALLKIDCEGAEYEILYTLPKELWPRIERICMEYHPVEGRDESWSGEGLVKYLDGVGHEAVLSPAKKRPRQGILFSVLRRDSARPVSFCQS